MALCAAGWASACSAKPVERAPLSNEQCTDDCGAALAQSGGGFRPARNNDGGVGGAGALGDDTEEPQLTVVTGSIGVLRAADLVLRSELTEERAEVVTPGTGDAWSSSGPIQSTFELRALSSLPVWFGVRPLSDRTGLVPTLWASTDLSSPLSLALVADVALDELLGVSFGLNGGATTQQGAGHAVLRFVNQAGRAAIGLQVYAEDGGRVAYDAGEAYSDQLLETGGDAGVVLINVPASAFPGGEVKLSLSFQGESYLWPLRVAAGAVTFATWAAPR